jgi:hypothetical protein
MIDRRGFLALCSQLGFGSTMLPAVFWAMAEAKSQITAQMIDAASKIADVPISDESKSMMLDSLNDFVKDYDLIYALKIPNDVPPAVVFDPVPPGMKLPPATRRSPL